MITCYLDSQDYSVLSDKKNENNYSEIKKDLIHLARSNEIKFCYSCLIASEIATDDPAKYKFSEARAEIVYEICGENSLRHHEEIIFNELNSLNSKETIKFNIHGPWFPDKSIDANNLFGINDIVIKKLDTFPSDKRRKIKKKIERFGVQKCFQELGIIENYSLFLDIFHLKDCYSKVKKDYLNGKASANKLRYAIYDSMRNLKLVAGTNKTNNELAELWVSFVRGPGPDIARVMRDYIDASQKLIDVRKLPENLGGNEENDPTSKNGSFNKDWRKGRDEIISNIISKLNKNLDFECSFESDDLPLYSPGLYCLTGASLEPLWTQITGSQKDSLLDSQPIDAFHSFYSPYVDFFRADRFMSPHIRKYTGKNTQVISRLSQLIPELKKRLA